MLIVQDLGSGKIEVAAINPTVSWNMLEIPRLKRLPNQSLKSLHAVLRQFNTASQNGGMAAGRPCRQSFYER